MEIRKVEGIIPLEAVSRDLPIKLENFSYKDMKNLLSRTIEGERKGNISEELGKNVFKAIFEGFTEGGRARINVGGRVISAEVDAELNLIPGDRLTLMVISTEPEVRLRLISVEREVKKALYRVLKSLLGRRSVEVLKKVPEILKRAGAGELEGVARSIASSLNPKELKPENLKRYVEAFLSPATVALLKSMGERDAASQLLLHIIIGYAFGTVELPLRVDDMESRVCVRVKEGEPLRVKVEVVYRDFGYVSCSILMVEDELSVEFTAEKGNTASLIRENLGELLSGIEAFGLRVVAAGVRVDSSRREFTGMDVDADSQLIDINV